MISDDLEEKIKAWVKKNHYDPYELYTDYDDEIDAEMVAKILRAENPRYELEDYLNNLDKYSYNNGYYSMYSFWEVEMDIMKECRKEFDIGDDVDDDELRETLWDCGMAVGADLNHFLVQEINVDVYLTNNEEENCEHTLNCIYPFNNGYPHGGCYFDPDLEKISDISNDSSLLWLAKKQGYGKRQFYDYMHEKPNAVKSEFLKSVREELENIWSSCGQVVFLQKYSLDELMDIVKEKSTLVIPVGTTCGLYDKANGAGSTLEIKLEKPVKIPYDRYDLRVSWGYRYSVDECYGLCDEMWRAAA